MILVFNLDDELAMIIINLYDILCAESEIYTYVRSKYDDDDDGYIYKLFQLLSQSI